MQIGSATAQQPTLLSTIQQVAGISPASRPENKPAVSAKSGDHDKDAKGLGGGQDGTVQAAASKSSTQRGSIVNLLI